MRISRLSKPKVWSRDYDQRIWWSWVASIFPSDGTNDSAAMNVSRLLLDTVAHENCQTRTNPVGYGAWKHYSSQGQRCAWDVSQACEDNPEKIKKSGSTFVILLSCFLGKWLLGSLWFENSESNGMENTVVGGWFRLQSHKSSLQYLQSGKTPRFQLAISNASRYMSALPAWFCNYEISAFWDMVCSEQ